MVYPEITGVLASITTKFGGDIAQWMSQLHKGIDIGASDSTLKPLINTDWRYKTGRLRFIDAQLPPNEITHNIANQPGARSIDWPVLAAGANVPLFLTLQQTPTNKILDSNNNITFLNVPSGSLTDRLAKSQQVENTVYTDQVNTFGAFDQKFLVNRLWIANAANNQWAKLGFLGTLSHNYDIVNVGADSYLLAVSKTSVADGDVFYWLGGKPIRLGIGANGKILKVVSNVPSWQDEIAASGLPSRNYFQTDYASSSTMGTNRYQSLSGDATVSTTFTQRQITFDVDIKITRVRANIITNSLNTGSLQFGIAGSGGFLASHTVAAGTTGLQSSGVLSVVIPAGTAIAFLLSTTTAASGTYEVRPINIEYEVGAPGAFEDSKVVVKELNVQIGSVARPLNFIVGTDFDLTENVGTGNTDIKIADNAIKTAHILDAQVTLSKLAADSVDTTKIAAAAVGADEIATGAVGSDELAANSVITSKILDRNVTETKIELALLNRLHNLPVRRDYGLVNGRDATADGMGLLNDITHDQVGSGYCAGTSPAEGTGVTYNTTATIGTRAGERTTNPVVMGSKNISFFVRFSIGMAAGTPTTNTRAFFGVIQSSTLANSNDPLDNLIGIGLMMRPSNTDFRMCHNNGGATDSQVATGITPGNDVIYSFYMHKVEGETKWKWYIWTTNGGDINQPATASGEITTLIPTGDTALYACASVINVTTQTVFLNRNVWGVEQDLTAAAP
jgi:hypothetical protein